MRVFEWLFVDEGPHACLSFLDDKKPGGGGGEAAIDEDGGVSDADKREAFARLNQAVAAVAVKRLRECRLAIPELLARMWARVWQAAAAASGGDDGAELAGVGLLSAISRVYERLTEHSYRDFFSRRLGANPRPCAVLDGSHVSCRVLRFVRVVRVAGQSRSMTSSLYDSLRTTRTSRSWQVFPYGNSGDGDPSSSSDPFPPRSLWWRPRSRP